MSKIIKIYCEGTKGSHDYEILEKVTAGLGVQIDPIGSIRGAGAIIQYIKNIKKVESADFYILFRDRDFDKAIPQAPMLEQDKEKEYCYYSYRNTVENYFFDTSWFFSFLEKENLCEKYSLHSESDVKVKFIDAAEKIKYYQAIRHTMGQMRTGETNFGTKLTKKSGELPERLDEEFCKDEAWKKITKAKSFADCWTQDSFLKIYQKFMDIFDRNDFMENLDFLIFFQGKDFATSLQSILSGFPLKNYYKFARENFDYHQFPDLEQLRKLIEQNQ
ncbi:MAG: hypothetical protein AB7S75_12140 [Desulfococcaceae bacterium]